jgi:hypothetical protein
VTRFRRLLLTSVFVLVALLAGACANESMGPAPTADSSAPELGQSEHMAWGRPGFTHCTPQPSDSSSARIGPNGGNLRAGKHTLRIPPGALKHSVLITMSAPSDSFNYVVFGPEGLAFDPANLPTLTLSYRNCFVTGAATAGLDIVYTDDSMTTVLDTTVTVASDTLSHTVGARLKHFSKYVLHSRYAVAY